MGCDPREWAIWVPRSCYYRLRGAGALLDRCGQLVVEDLGWLADLEVGEDLPLALGGGRTLGDATCLGGQGDQMHPVEFVAQVEQGVAGRVLGDADEQQAEPAQLDVGADAVLAVVVDRSQP